MSERRGHNEGSVSNKPRKDGRWMSRLTLEDGTRKVFYGKTKTEARNKLRDAIRDQHNGTLVTGPDQTVVQFLAHWLQNVVKQSVRPRTFESYDLNVRRILPHLGKVKLQKLTPAHVQECYSALLEGGLSRRSVEQAHAVLHRACRQALLWGRIGRNPTEAVSVPRPSRHEMKTLSQEQVQQLLNSTKEDRLHTVWVLLVTTGVRLGEATGLKWEDIELASDRMMIRRALQWQKGNGLVLVEPKTERSRRTVHLAAGTVAALKEHRRRQLEERLLAGSLWEDSGLVFASPLGKPLHPTWVNHHFHAALKQAGLPDVRVHDLRHTAATLLLGRGVHPKVVQELLGHSTITLTLDTYSHVVPALHAEVAAHMDTLFTRRVESI